MDLILVHPEKAQKPSQPSILKSYLSIPDSNTKHMSPYQIWRECFNLVFAGPGSAAAVLTAIFFEMGSLHGRKWQERIRVDLSAEAAPAGSSVVILAVIMETMRLHSPFPPARRRRDCNSRLSRSSACWLTRGCKHLRIGTLERDLGG